MPMDSINAWRMSQEPYEPQHRLLLVVVLKEMIHMDNMGDQRFFFLPDPRSPGFIPTQLILTATGCVLLRQSSLFYG